jgi:hypothetical protein
MASYDTKTTAAMTDDGATVSGRSRQKSLGGQIAGRTMALTIGLIGAVIAFVMTLLYSAFHTVGRIAGISNDSSHLFIGLLLSLGAFIGALLSAVSPLLGALLLAITAIGFFFIIGWWALLAAPFLLWAAFVAWRHRLL